MKLNLEKLKGSTHAAALAWCVEGLTSSERVVLLCLANFANERGSSWPSQRTIGDMCELSRQRVNTILHSLAKKDVIDIETRTRVDGSQSSNRYHLNYLTPLSGKLTPPVRKVDTPLSTNVDTIEPTIMNQPSEPIKTTPPNPPKGEDEKKTKNVKFDPTSLSLPSVVKRQTWLDFCEHRQLIKKPLNRLAATRILRKLEEYDKPNACLDRSIENGWAGVFPLKEAYHGGTSTSSGGGPTPPSFRKVGGGQAETYERDEDDGWARDLLGVEA